MVDLVVVSRQLISQLECLVDSRSQLENAAYLRKRRIAFVAPIESRPCLLFLDQTDLQGFLQL